MRRSLSGVVRFFGLLLACASPALATAAIGLDDPLGLAQATREGVTTSYLATRERYAQALEARPHDVALAIAACRYIEQFTSDDEPDYVARSTDDLIECTARLEHDFVDAPAARLYLLEVAPDDKVTGQADDLLGRAQAWPTPDATRLHERLAQAWSNTGDKVRAGKEALAAVALDAHSVAVGRAAAYLATAGRAEEARKLLVDSPAPIAWDDTDRRITAAQTLKDSALVLQQLELAKAAKIDPGVVRVARIELDAGAVDAAAATLAKAPDQRDTAALRDLRFDVALARQDTAAAAAIVRGELGQRGDLPGLATHYFRLLAAAPTSFFSLALLPVSLALLLMLIFLAALPAALLVPVHYRGLARRVQGRLPAPLFDGRLRLRHAWYALAVFMLAPILVTAVIDTEHLGVMLGAKAASMDVSYALLWGSAIGLLLQAPVWRRLGWRQLIGSSLGFGATAWRIGLSWLGIFATMIALGLWIKFTGHDLPPTAQTKAVEAVMHGMQARYGIAGTLFLMAVLVPYVEELVFRGALLGAASRHIGFAWANLLQALTFALAHGDPPRLALYLVIGLLGGWLTRRTGGLLAAFILHAINNALFLLLQITLLAK